MKTTTTIPSPLPMGGWKTWAAAAGLFAIGVFEIVGAFVIRKETKAHTG